MADRQVSSKYWNPYTGGALLGVLLYLSYVLTGGGLGVSGALSRVTVAGERVFAQGHVNRTPYLGEMAGGKKNPLDFGLVYSLVGVVLGGFVSGALRGRVKVETYRGPLITDRQRWVFALIGGVLMGYGARLARGCTSGQALSGGAVLSAGSWAFMFAVFGGAYGLAYFVRRMWAEKEGA